MSEYSARSQELAKQLRAKALRNLGRSSDSAQFASGLRVKAHPSTTASEKRGRSASGK